MEFGILDWNVAGAKFFAAAPAERARWRSSLNASLAELVELHEPHVVLLQEIVRYGDPEEPEDLIEPPPGYHYQPRVIIDSDSNAHPGRWERFRRGSGAWSESEWLAQGCGLLWRSDLAHAPLWSLDPRDARPGTRIMAETVRLDTGLYTGSRDTEPRLAVVVHFVVPDGEAGPLDVFVVNLHLTTLKGEREGRPARDELGMKVRMAQIRSLLHGVVSRFEEWRSEEGVHPSRPHPVWILAGDFNALPWSHEVRYLEGMNFVDLNPSKGSGSKRSGTSGPATLTLDYIFAGPAYLAFDPYVLEQRIRNNPEPLHGPATGVSDHLPLLARLRIDPRHPSVGAYKVCGSDVPGEAR